MSAEDTNRFNVQGYNIVTILKRLEAATSRLEDITVFQSKVQPPDLLTEDAPKQVGGDTGVAAAPDTTPVAAAVAKETDSAAKPTLPPAVAKFDEFIDTFVDPWVKSSIGLDSQVGEAATLFRDALKAEVPFLVVALQLQKPDITDPTLPKLLEPINQRVLKIVEIKDNNRPSSFFSHLSTISEGSPVLGWVMLDTPVSFVPEFKDAASFYSNRILKDSKDREDAKTQQEWVKSFLAIFDELKNYVKQYQTTGPQWNPNGLPLDQAFTKYGDVQTSVPQTPASTPVTAGAPTAGGPPPPPPPPPPADLFAPDANEGGMTAVFADLNKGEDITKGLKKVDKLDMTHKNPELRNRKPLPPKKPAKLGTKSPTGSINRGAASAPPKKVAKIELVDNKWLVEGQYNVAEPIVISAEMNHLVFIGHCLDCTIQIKGKANAISVTATKNVGVVVDSLILGVDIIKLDKFGLQVLGVVPMVSIDKCDQGNLYISQESVDADIKIYSTSSQSLNINVPLAEDFVELAVPEQFEHQIKNGKLVSLVVEHAG